MRELDDTFEVSACALAALCARQWVFHFHLSVLDGKDGHRTRARDSLGELWCHFRFVQDSQMRHKAIRRRCDWRELCVVFADTFVDIAFHVNPLSRTELRDEDVVVNWTQRLSSILVGLWLPFERATED